MKTTFRITAPQFERLERHLFPGDEDEHGAVIAAGIVETPHERRLLAREVFIAKDGVDYVPGKFGYRALTPDFVARVSHHCARERLAYFAVHCHGGRDSVGFSETDLKSHQRGYPALVDITNGGPVGALVFAANAVAGEVWTPAGMGELDSMAIIGLNTRRLYPKLPCVPGLSDGAFHRQSLMFGAVGQHQLAQAKVGIIGLGGVGSLVNEYVARLGVGTIVAVDYDYMEDTNRPRVVGSRVADCRRARGAGLFGWFKKLRHGPALKVKVAERVALEANPKVRFRAIAGDVTHQAAARELRDLDFIFLCADSMQSRLVFNALVHQYLVPGIQIGSKVPVDKRTGKLGNVFSAARPVLPQPGGGCLWCIELIPAAMLQAEALSEAERRQQRYVEDDHIVAPSVITLNALGAAQAANDFLFHYLGLFDCEQAEAGYLLHHSRERRWRHADCRSDAGCLHCGTAPRSAYARGDRVSLPCKG